RTNGAANIPRRTALETDDQDQWDVRVDQRFGSNRDHVFGRVSSFHGGFTPVTPLPDGSGVTSGTLGPQRTNAWSFASTYRRTLGAAALNELRAGDTQRTVARRAAELDGPAGAALGIPGIPSAQFPDTLPTFLVGGYQQIGSPPNTASDFNTSVTEIADTLTL